MYSDLAIHQEFIKRFDYLDPVQNSECIIKLRIFGLDVENFMYSLPVIDNQREHVLKAKEMFGMVPTIVVLLKHKVKVKYRISYVGGSEEKEFETKFVSLLDVSQYRGEHK